MRSSTGPARVSLAVAVALRQALRALLAQAGAGQAAYLQLHQPLGGKADHLAQKIGISALLQQPSQGHHLVGHRGLSGQEWISQPKPSRQPPMTTSATPPTGTQPITVLTTQTLFVGLIRTPKPGRASSHLIRYGLSAGRLRLATLCLVKRTRPWLVSGAMTACDAF
jgi:hypothetical protein